MQVREAAKEDRRRRIVDAARSLVTETGHTGFSMRALAERAGVSIATPYNLMGSKQAIMAALLDEDMQNYGAQMARSRKDALDLFFHAVSLGCKFFDGDSDYYRTVLGAVYSEGGPEYRSMFSGPRMAFWRSLVKDAIDKGYLSKATDSDLFAITLANIYFACILEWVAGAVPLKTMEARTQYGFALLLASVVTPEYRQRMQAELARRQARARRLKRKSATAGG